MSIPETIRERLEKAVDSDEAKQVGIEIAKQMLFQIKSEVQGIYLMPPFG